MLMLDPASILMLEVSRGLLLRFQTGNAGKEYTLDDFKGEFDELKELLSSEPFSEDIGYTENAFREYDVLDLIQRLTLFCTALYPNTGDSQPIIAYRSKAKCLEQFVNEKSKYLAMRPIISACFKLPDKIAVLLPEVSGSEKFGRFTFARRQNPEPTASLKGEARHRDVENWNSEYAISEAVIYPLTASLRVLVRSKSDGTILGWRQDPVRFFKKNGRSLFKSVRRYYDDAGKSLTALGKNSEFWSKLHHAAYVALHPED